jgi:dTDP-glucose 4,6-dehydratase/UDP-glucose 4-epimerase
LRSPLPDAEIGRILERTPQVWEALRGASLFVTGGTGFFGRWLLETLARADDRHRLGLSVLVLTRDIQAFRAAAPQLAGQPCMRFLAGDVRSFPMPEGKFRFVLHGAATSARATFEGEDPLVKFDTALEGTRRVLDFARRCEARRVLMVGSGSVYGAPAAGMTHIGEDYRAAPDTLDLVSALGQGKRAAELLCAYYAANHGLEIPIARCFSFVGPGLPLDIHYAIGNFIRDALWSDAITVRGDGSAIRSYLYVGDCIAWLLTLLLDGHSARIYNVGSDASISMRELAELVRDVVSPHKRVDVLGARVAGPAPNVYVPDIRRARAELRLDVWTPLPEAIRLTAEAARASV